MNIDIPDHYVANVGGAMVAHAVTVINGRNMVPAYLHQFADLWDKGLRYDAGSFWEAVYNKGAKWSVFAKAGIIPFEGE